MDNIYDEILNKMNESPDSEIRTKPICESDFYKKYLFLLDNPELFYADKTADIREFDQSLFYPYWEFFYDQIYNSLRFAGLLSFYYQENDLQNSAILSLLLEAIQQNISIEEKKLHSVSLYLLSKNDFETWQNNLNTLNQSKFKNSIKIDNLFKVLCNYQQKVKNLDPILIKYQEQEQVQHYQKIYSSDIVQ